MAMNPDPGTGVGSTGGIRGSNAPVQPLQEQVKLNVQESVPDYGSAFRAMAFTPNALGEFGSQLALQSGIQMSKMRGQALGEHPDGELLPAINDVDKAFVDSYSAQAQTTLGLQANQMMDKAQEELNQAYELSPGMISDYEKNMGEGLQEIINHAPSTVRTQMQNQYGNQLLNSSHQLNMQMISQQKSRATSNQEAYAQHQLEQMHDAALNKNPALAKEIYENIAQNAKSNGAIGMFSPTQTAAAIATAKQTYYSSLEIANALEARNAHQLEPYLNGMITNKPSELTWGEWEDVRAKTIQYVGQVESFAAREQTLLLSQMRELGRTGQLTPENIAYFRSNVQPAAFNNAMAQTVSKTKAETKTQRKIAEAIKFPDSTEVWSGLTADEKNATFDSLVDGQIAKAKAKGVDITKDQAKAMVAKTVAGPVPKYVKEIGLNATSPNPELLEHAAEAIHIMETGGAYKNLEGLSDNARNTAMAYLHYSMQGMPPDVAAEQAIQTVTKKTKEQRILNNEMVADWRRRKANTPDQKASFAKQFIKAGKAYIPNSNALYMQISNTYEDYLRQFNGDHELAKQKLQQGMDRAYGITKVNGREEYVFAPIEKELKLPEGAQSLIQDDIYNKIDSQIQSANTAYQNGTSPFFYRKVSRITLDEYMKAKAKVQELMDKKSKGLPWEGITESRATIAKFEAGQPVEIEQVYRDNKVEKFEVSVQPSPYLSISTGDDATIGGYDMLMRPKNGRPVPFMGPFYGPINPPVYQPDKNKIMSNYFIVNNIQPDSRSLTEQAQELIEKMGNRTAGATQARANIL